MTEEEERRRAEIERLLGALAAVAVQRAAARDRGDAQNHAVRYDALAQAVYRLCGLE
jgi:hypothetical protein